MVSNNPTANPATDVAYTMPEANMLELAFQAAGAFRHSGISAEVPDAVRAELSASRKISEKDVADMTNLLLSRVGFNLTNPRVQAMLSRIESSLNEPRSNMDVLLAQIESTQNKVDKDVEAGSPEQQMERLWVRIEALNKKINDQFEELAAYTTDEEKKALRLANERVAAAKAVFDSDRTPENLAALQAAQEDRGQVQIDIANRVERDHPETAPITSDIRDHVRDRKRIEGEYNNAGRAILSARDEASREDGMRLAAANEASPAVEQASAAVAPVSMTFTFGSAAAPAPAPTPANNDIQVAFAPTDEIAGDMLTPTPLSVPAPGVGPAGIRSV